MNLNFTVRRTGKLEENLRAYQKRLEEKLVLGNEAAAKVLLEESLKLVPRDTGVLAKSGQVRRHGSGAETRFEVGFGWPDVAGEFVVSEESGFVGFRKASEYAVPVHELPLKHNVGQAEYMRQPINSSAVRDEMKRALRAEVTK